jgi:NADH:ubiquinone oxidoreductase subunit C
MGKGSIRMVKTNKLCVYLERIFCKGITGILVKEEYLTINLKKEYLKVFLMFLKVHWGSKIELLLDIWGVDYPEEGKRFEINYMGLGIRYGWRVVIKLHVAESEVVHSIGAVYNSGMWLEREVWDMYGVYFEGNTDLRRILTDYGFEGYPLRKDFPLMGYVELRYDDSHKRVVVEPIEMAQEYRLYEFVSPWEIIK